MTTTLIIVFYLTTLLALGLFSNRLFRGTAADYFLASHSIGPFLLLMSIFGTTMTAFALVGSTGEAYRAGIGVYGKMASWSGLVHSAVFFIVGIKLWGFGKRYGYVTQIQFFRDRFESNAIGLLLFPVLVGLVIPYLLIGLLGTGSVVRSLTIGAFPEHFPQTKGGIPPWLSTAVICLVVLTYVFWGGLRGAAWANTFQTLVFMITGLITFVLIAHKLGGLSAATAMAKPEKLIRGDEIHHLQFLTYAFVPLSVGMFPHLFQHWLTAKSAKSFRLSVIAHPLCIMIVWVPCILIGIWATGATFDGKLVVPPSHPPNAELAIMVKKLTNPILSGVLGAGILAAIMSSLDSQFFCLGTMFTNDIVIHHFGSNRFTDKQKIWMARGFITVIVLATYLLALSEPRRVFTMGVWCFSGFASLFPLVFATLYWRRITKEGAMASIISMAVVWFILFQRSGFGQNPNYLIMNMMPVTFIFAASAITLVVVSLVTSPPQKITLDKFFR